MMDALRPYLPFAVQQDNYWLKYSLLRDVSVYFDARTLMESKRTAQTREFVSHISIFYICRLLAQLLGILHCQSLALRAEFCAHIVGGGNHAGQRVW